MPLSESERMALAVLVNGDARLNSPARRKPEAALVRLTGWPVPEVALADSFGLWDVYCKDDGRALGDAVGPRSRGAAVG